MKYPDEENKALGVEEIPCSEEKVLNGFPIFDTQSKIDVILDTGVRQDVQVDNTPIYEKSEELFNKMPTIDTEEKIKQILDF